MKETERGSVTIYFSFVLLLIIALLGAMIEGARMSSVKARLPQAARAACESLLAGYERDLFSEYGLLYFRSDARTLSELTLSGYLLPEADANAGRLSKRVQLLRLEDPNISIVKEYRALSANGANFKRQVLELMKYQEISDIIQTVSDMIDGKSNAADCIEMVDENRDAYDNTDWQEKADELEAINQNIDVDDENFIHAGNGNVNQTVQGDVSGSIVGEIENFVGQALVYTILGETVSSAVTGELFFYEPFLMMEGEEVELDFAQRILFDEYVMSYFGNVKRPSGTGLAYEQEYILNGTQSDSMNLLLTLKSILDLRTGLNLISILANAELRMQARALAVVLVGWTGLEVLVLATQMMIALAWAAGEGILDLRALAKGLKVPFYKKTEAFESTPIDCIGRIIAGDYSKGNKTGIDYDMYMRFLLATSGDGIYVRTMKMIDLNMRIEDKGFSFIRMLYGIRVRAEADIKPMFSGAYAFLTKSGGSYHITADAEKKYN